MTSPRTSLGVLEVGGTHIAAGLVDLSGGLPKVLQLTRVDLDSSASAPDILAALVSGVRELSTGRRHQWAVAIPGPFDYPNGIGRYHEVGKLDALNGVDVRAELSQRLGQPGADFSFVNDAAAFALGEWLVGAARGLHRVISITLGTGVGSAFIRDGQLVEDEEVVPPHGYLYLLTIAGRPLEDTVSRRALLRRYAELTGHVERNVDVRDLADRARGRDAAAIRTFADAFTALGRALAPWTTLFGADGLVAGGSIAEAWDLIEPALTVGLGERTGSARCPVWQSRVKEAAIIGAAWHAATSHPDQVAIEHETNRPAQ